MPERTEFEPIPIEEIPIEVSRMSERQVREFAEALEAEVANRNFRAFDEAVDFEAMLDRVHEKLQGHEAFSVTESRKDSMLEAYRREKEREPFSRILAKTLGPAGDFGFVRTGEQGAHPTVLFRLASPSGKINYHLYTLSRFTDGKIRIVDILSFDRGESMTELLYQKAINDYRRDPDIDRLSSEQVWQMAEVDAQLRKYFELAAEQKWEELLDFYPQLSDEIRRQRPVQLIRLKATYLSDPENAEKVAETIQARFPDRPGMELMALEYYWPRGKFDQARIAIDRLDERVGGDPWLHFLRGSSFLEEKAYPKAEKAFGQFIEGFPHSILANRSLLLVLAEQDDFARACELLTEMDERLGAVIVNNILLEDRFTPLLESKEFQSWESERLGDEMMPEEHSDQKN
jgi:tetratricopeptide (TPR) repeat protein